MIGALATLFFFAITPVFATRSAQLLGSLRANLWRLIVAACVLAVWAHVFGTGLGGVALTWFVLGGIVGFGVGGIAMFNSLPRIGSTLSTLIVQCLSALTAAAVEWLWLGTVLSRPQISCAVLTLAGVTIGLLPRSLPRPDSSAWRAGVAWAVVSAIGQGVGAVISRKAFAVAASAGQLIDPGTAAYQRVLGGLAVAALAVALIDRRARLSERPLSIAWPWVAANAATGPILGVTCYQWALRTTPAGIVQPIVAAAPLLTIPFAMLLERTRPGAMYYAGATLAIAGVSGLMIWR